MEGGKINSAVQSVLSQFIVLGGEYAALINERNEAARLKAQKRKDGAICVEYSYCCRSKQAIRFAKNTQSNAIE